MYCLFYIMFHLSYTCLKTSSLDYVTLLCKSTLKMSRNPSQIQPCLPDIYSTQKCFKYNYTVHKEQILQICTELGPCNPCNIVSINMYSDENCFNGVMHVCFLYEYTFNQLQQLSLKFFASKGTLVKKTFLPVDFLMPNKSQCVRMEEGYNMIAVINSTITFLYGVTILFNLGIYCCGYPSVIAIFIYITKEANSIIYVATDSVLVWALRKSEKNSASKYSFTRDATMHRYCNIFAQTEYNMTDLITYCALQMYCSFYKLHNIVSVNSVLVKCL